MSTRDDLRALRESIDSVDDRILTLLEERAGLAKSIAEIKRAKGLAFHDPVRERQVLDRLTKKAAGRFPETSIRGVFREIMSGCLSLEQPITVAFMGPEATSSHKAALEIFGLSARYRETTTTEGVFDAVCRGDATYGVVPVENSAAGAVSSTLDALVESEIMIQQEVVVEVTLALLSRAPGVTAVERVYSQDQPLSQSRLWLAKNLAGAQLIQTASTVVAVHQALADEHAAAIASPLASELYGIPVLRDRIQDREKNATRFLVVGKEDSQPTGHDKTTLAFALRDAEERGALRRALEVFDQAGINLSRIESRPKGSEPWKYVFLVDIEAHRTEPVVGQALRELHARCEMVKVLGSYPRALP